MIVSVTVADLVVSVCEVAAIVTVPPVGATAGAVYVVPNCAGVDVGLNEPQAIQITSA